MANEFRKVIDTNNLVHPVCDDTRVDWESYAKTGVHQFITLPLYSTSVTSGSATYTAGLNADGLLECEIDGAVSAYMEVQLKNRTSLPLSLQKGKYKVTGGYSPNLYLKVGHTKNGEWEVLAETSGSEVEFTLTEDDKSIGIFYGIQPNQTYDHLKLYPMIRLADDPVTEPTPPAMTNPQLTDALSIREGTSLISGSDMTINDCAVAKAGNIRVYSIRATANTNIPADNNILSGFDDPLFNYDAMMSISAYTADGTEYKLISYTGAGKLYLKPLSSIPTGTLIRFTFTYIAK